MRGGPPAWEGRSAPHLDKAVARQEWQDEIQRRMMERQIPPPMEERQRYEAVQFAIAFYSTEQADEIGSQSAEDLIRVAETIYKYIKHGKDGEGEDKQNGLDDHGDESVGLALPT